MQTKKKKGFFAEHWLDVVVVVAILAALYFLCAYIAKEFKFEKKWAVFYRFFIENNGYKKLLTGMKNTGIIAVSGLAIGIFIGTVIAMVKVIPPYQKITRYFQTACNIYVGFFRGTPIVVQILVGYYILFPLMRLKVDPVLCCVIIFGLNSGAYISEIMRGGLNSVDPGQLEAARAVGLSFPISMIKVVVPQAVRNVLPTLGNEFIALIKETAIVGYVGAIDVTKAFQDQGANTYEFMIPYLVMALFYIVVVAIIAFFVKLMERKLGQKNGRHRDQH